MAIFLRHSALLSCTTFYTVLVCLTAGGSSEWRPDAPAGRVLMTSCASHAACAPIATCGYCPDESFSCDNGFRDTTPCTTEQGDGTCSSGVCQVCASEADCLVDRDSDCVGCTVTNGVQSCDVASYENQACTSDVGGSAGTCVAGQCMNGVVNDPIISGFDGTKMHFDEVGDFTLIQEGGGWKVEATFSAAPTIEEGGPESRESSWTTAVRVASPQGDLVSCSIPAVFPNTSLVQVFTSSAGSDPIALSPHVTETTLDQMSASAILSWKEYAGVQYSSVVGCKVLTPLMDIKVYQVSGWEEAQAKPEEHGWAAPFTWLNIDFHIRKRLAAPVTGIMGDTYPKEGVELTNRDTVAVGVGEEGIEEAASARQLRKSSPFHLSFSLVGL